MSNPLKPIRDYSRYNSLLKFYSFDESQQAETQAIP